MSEATPLADRPAQNQMRGYRQLLTYWDRPAPSAPLAAPPARSPLGNINDRAAADCFVAAIFPPRDPRFAASLEAGVRDLVLTLVEERAWVTYTSCEGHPPTAAAPRRLRGVGLVGRSPEELERLAAEVARAADAANVVAATPTTRLRVVRKILDTEEGATPCVNIEFASDVDDWTTYVVEADRLQEALITALLAGLPQTEMTNALGERIAVQRFSWPFRHAVARGAAPEDFCRRLKAAIHDEDWVHGANGADSSSKFTPNISKLIAELASSGEDVQGAARRLAETFGDPLATYRQVGMHRMVPGNVINLHTDEAQPGYPTHRVLLYLDQHGRDYEGGELCFHASRDQSAVERRHRLDAGTMLAFCGGQTTYHSVAPLTYGQRLAVTFYFFHVGNTPSRIAHLRELVASAVAEFPAAAAAAPAPQLPKDHPGRIKEARQAKHLTEVAALLMSFGVAADDALALVRRGTGRSEQVRGNTLDVVSPSRQANAKPRAPDDMEQLGWWATRLSGRLHIPFLASAWQTEADRAAAAAERWPSLRPHLEALYLEPEPS